MGFWALSVLLGLRLVGTIGTNDAQIRWSPPGAIVVNVVNRDLSPVPGAVVSVYRADAPGGEPKKSAAANVGGHVEFRGLPAGSYMVRVKLSGFLDMGFGPVPVQEKTPASVRIPEILAVLNPVMVFEIPDKGHAGREGVR
jgi:Carboxypeptidase regulatory-like domain